MQFWPLLKFCRQIPSDFTKLLQKWNSKILSMELWHNFYTWEKEKLFLSLDALKLFLSRNREKRKAANISIVTGRAKMEA